jgi:hypothetical protein
MMISANVGLIEAGGDFVPGVYNNGRSNAQDLF